VLGSVLLMCMAQSCTTSVKVSVTASHTDGVPTFSVKRRGGTGLGYLKIWNTDTKSPVWGVALNHFPGGTIAYGKVPTDFKILSGETSYAIQEFPPGKEKPAPLPANSRFCLSIVYEYDGFLAPGSFRPVYFLFVTDEHGRIVNIDPVARIESEPPTSAWRSSTR
jgi:hypothetical protein